MTPNSWLRLPTPHAVGRGPRRSIRVITSSPAVAADGLLLGLGAA
jgi:hypothetical protein